MTAAPWWHDAVFYQIYPRSFQDSNGDGIGDLRGVIARLDHLVWLGVEGMWLNPVTPSPNADWGYDVSDYTDVHPDLGTLEDLDELIAEAESRNIKVILDLVPNHTSDRHPWFRDALTSRDAPHRDWYVWADPDPAAGPPNNWLSVFGGGPAWTLHKETGQYYLHNFLSEQPDLNWWNEHVRTVFDDILRYWFDRGIAGFRIDVAHAIVKDRELRDNPLTDDVDHPEVRRLGQKQLYNMNRPEGHDVIRRWRAVAESYEEPRILVGETYVLELEDMASFYGKGRDELNLAFNFPFVFSDPREGTTGRVVEDTGTAIPSDAWPAWMGSNHDVGRFSSRWCDGDPDLIRCGLMMLLTLRGTIFLYYGDEIGMTNADVPRERLRDPVGIRQWPLDLGRDGCRTPMRWSSEEGGGFTEPGVEPWLPFGSNSASVAEQRSDPKSILILVRDLIAFRRDSEDLLHGDYERLGTAGSTWAFRRGSQTIVALNLSDETKELEGFEGEIAISTDRALDGQAVSGALDVRARSGVVIVQS